MGWVGIVGSAAGLSAATLPQASAREAELRLGDSIKAAIPSEKPFADLIKRLRDYFDGKKVVFPDRLDLSPATDFERAVWRIIQTIPYGETRSYGWVAARLGKRGARAVGQALARNRLPVIIPCHRVVASDGSLGGYSGGVDVKKSLLRLEAHR
jgi:methylated-DNA-[protein]-cysteine S-methyltransferase